ncbi:MAG: DUF1761 domain-containing protein [Gemmatimonadales bacterium]
MPEVNYLAVLVAAVAAFILGAIWYSPALFAPAWMAEARITPPAPGAPKPSMGGLFLLAFVTALIAAYAMAVLLVRPEHHSLLSGIKRGIAAGLCWVAMSFASSYAFERRSMRLWLINAGYFVVQFAVMGAVLGVMNGLPDIMNH